MSDGDCHCGGHCLDENDTWRCAGCGGTFPACHGSAAMPNHCDGCRAHQEDAEAQCAHWVAVCERIHVMQEAARREGRSADAMYRLARMGRVAAKACKQWDDRRRDRPSELNGVQT